MKIDLRKVWFGVFFIILSYVSTLDFHVYLSYLWWKYLHIVSTSIFTGIIIISSILETVIFLSNDIILIDKYHKFVQNIDKIVITSSVSIILFSAIAMMNYSGYHLWSIESWPLWSMLALLIFLANGLMWLLFDIKTQNILADILSNISAELNISKMRYLVKLRLIINILSIFILLTFYYLMIFKPI